MRNKIVDSYYVAAFFSLTIFLFAPLQIYLSNRLEFPYLFSKAFISFAAIAFFVTLLITLLLLTFNLSLFRRIVPLIFIISFLMWFQGNIMVWNYGKFYGNTIDWHKYFFRDIADGAIWVLFMSIAILKPKYIYIIFRKVTAFIIIIQFLYLIRFAGFAHPLPSRSKFETIEENIFNFSKKRNVIMLILDGFQSDVFQEIIDEDNKFADFFAGFTYFRNSLSGLGNTYAAVPLILTGHYFDNSLPMSEFLKKEFTTNSLPVVLKNNGFRVEIYPYWYSNAIYFDTNIFSNLEKSEDTIFIDSIEDILSIYKFAFFRYAPQIIKRYIYDRIILSQEIDSDFLEMEESRIPKKYINSSNIKLLKEMTVSFFKGEDQEMFKFIHIQGMHPPLVFNENMEYELFQFNRENYKRQAKGLLKIVKKFLDRLKEIDIYDNSLILVLGDHGFLGDIYIPTEMKEQRRKIGLATNAISRGGRPLPLILIKPFYASGKMTTRDGPVCLSDVFNTIALELGLKCNIPGRSMFSVKDSDNRKLRYLMYNWSSRYELCDFLPVMEEYVVSGFSWFENSWQKTGRQYWPKKVGAYDLKSYYVKIKNLITEK